jgi:hypothetical protein
MNPREKSNTNIQIEKFRSAPKVLGDNAWASVFKDQTATLSIMEFRRRKRSAADDAKGATRTREERQSPDQPGLNFRGVSPQKIRA